MNQLYSALLQLQDLDLEIAKAEAHVAEFTPRLDEIRGPMSGLQKEVDLARTRLDELRTQQRKLEQGSLDKQNKLKMFEERVQKARSIRDEAATRTEMDLIRRAVEAEVSEAADTTEQVQRADMKLDDLEKALAKAKDDVAPKEQEIATERDAAVNELKTLQDRRNEQVKHMDKNVVRLYERVRSGKRKTALAPLTGDGACGNCFNVLPPQEQAEIRHGRELRRCEACGVILYPVSA